MPCNCDHMAPCEWESAGTESAGFAAYALKKLKRPVDARLTKISVDIYPTKEDADYAVSTLCSLMQGLSKRDLNKVAYDAKCKTSRRLADWWERHQEDDKERLAEVLRKRMTKAARASALKKLTAYERELLGLERE